MLTCCLSLAGGLGPGSQLGVKVAQVHADPGVRLSLEKISGVKIILKYNKWAISKVWKDRDVMFCISNDKLRNVLMLTDIICIILFPPWLGSEAVRITAITIIALLYRSPWHSECDETGDRERYHILCHTYFPPLPCSNHHQATSQVQQKSLTIQWPNRTANKTFF